MRGEHRYWGTQGQTKLKVLCLKSCKPQSRDYKTMRHEIVLAVRRQKAAEFVGRNAHLEGAEVNLLPRHGGLESKLAFGLVMSSTNPPPQEPSKVSKRHTPKRFQTTWSPDPSSPPGALWRIRLTAPSPVHCSHFVFTVKINRNIKGESRPQRFGNLRKIGFPVYHLTKWGEKYSRGKSTSPTVDCNQAIWSSLRSHFFCLCAFSFSLFFFMVSADLA